MLLYTIMSCYFIRYRSFLNLSFPFNYTQTCEKENKTGHRSVGSISSKTCSGTINSKSVKSYGRFIRSQQRCHRGILFSFVIFLLCLFLLFVLYFLFLFSSSTGKIRHLWKSSCGLGWGLFAVVSSSKL